MSDFEEYKNDTLKAYLDTIREQIETLSRDLILLSWIVQTIDGDYETIKEIERIAIDLKNLRDELTC